MGEKVIIHGFDRYEMSREEHTKYVENLRKTFKEFNGKFPFEVKIDGIIFMIDSDASFEALEEKGSEQLLKEAALKLAKILGQSMR